MEDAHAFLGTLANTLLASDAILSSEPSPAPTSAPLEPILLGLSDVLVAVGGPSSPEPNTWAQHAASMEARQLLRALSQALYIRMAGCWDRGAESFAGRAGAARSAAQRELDAAEGALGGLVRTLSQVLGVPGCVGLAASLSQHALLLGRPSALEPIPVLLAACPGTCGPGDVAHALTAIQCTARHAAWLAESGAKDAAPGPAIRPSLALCGAVIAHVSATLPDGAQLSATECADAVSALARAAATAAAGGLTMESGPPCGRAEAPRSLASPTEDVGLLWVGLAHAANRLCTARGGCALETAGTLVSALAAAVDVEVHASPESVVREGPPVREGGSTSEERDSGNAGSRGAAAGAVLDAVLEMSVGGAVTLVTPGPAGAGGALRLCEWLAWLAARGRDEGLRVAAASALRALLAPADARRHMAMAMARRGSWGARRGFTPASERAGQMALRLHEGTLVALRRAAASGMWLEALAAAQVLASLTAITPYASLPEAVLLCVLRVAMEALERVPAGPAAADAHLPLQEAVVQAVAQAVGSKVPLDARPVAPLADTLMAQARSRASKKLLQDSLTALRGLVDAFGGLAPASAADVAALAEALMSAAREDEGWGRAAAQCLQLAGAAAAGVGGASRDAQPALERGIVAGLAHPVAAVRVAALTAAATSDACLWMARGEAVEALLTAALAVLREAARGGHGGSDAGERRGLPAAAACRVLAQVARRWDDLAAPAHGPTLKDIANAVRAVASSGGVGARGAAADTARALCEAGGAAMARVLWPTALELGRDVSDKVQPYGLHALCAVLAAVRAEQGKAGTRGGSGPLASLEGLARAEDGHEDRDGALLAQSLSVAAGALSSPSARVLLAACHVTAHLLDHPGVGAYISKSQEVASELLRLLGTAALPVDARALAMAALRAGMRAARDVPAVLRAACRAWRDAPTDGSAPHAAALLAAAAEAFGPPETWTAAQAVGWAAAVAEEGVWASLSAAPRQSP